MSLVPLYEMDGSFESFMRLIRDAAAGVPAACDIIEGYRQYQELSREVLLKRLPPPRTFYEPGMAVVVNGNNWWAITGPHGEPTSAELAGLRRELDKRLPAKPHVHCDVTGCTEKKPYAPPGVNITSHQRIGDEVRDTYLNHLGARFSDGSMDQAEFEARSDAAVKARTREELESLIQDLPKLTEKKGEPLPEKEGKRNRPVLSLLMFLACIHLIFAPGIGMFTIVWVIAAVAWGTAFLGQVLHPSLARYLSGKPPVKRVD